MYERHEWKMIDSRKNIVEDTYPCQTCRLFNIAMYIIISSDRTSSEANTIAVNLLRARAAAKKNSCLHCINEMQMNSYLASANDDKKRSRFINVH